MHVCVCVCVCERGGVGVLGDAQTCLSLSQTDGQTNGCLGRGMEGQQDRMTGGGGGIEDDKQPAAQTARQ